MLKLSPHPSTDSLLLIEYIRVYFGSKETYWARPNFGLGHQCQINKKNLAWEKKFGGFFFGAAKYCLGEIVLVGKEILSSVGRKRNV